MSIVHRAVQDQSAPTMEDLRAEVEYLRGELALDDDAARINLLRVALGLTPQQARLLQLLYVRAGRVVSTQTLDGRLPARSPDGRWTLDVLKVLVCHLRRQLGPEAIATFSGGYSLTLVAKARIDRQLAQEAA